jgi:hypothetical protein
MGFNSAFKGFIYLHFRTCSPHLQGTRELEIPHVCIEQFPATQEKMTKSEETSEMSL